MEKLNIDYREAIQKELAELIMVTERVLRNVRVLTDDMQKKLNELKGGEQ